MVSRWDELSVHTRATAAMGTKFLHDLQARLPFPVNAIQVDGGSASGSITPCAHASRWTDTPWPSILLTNTPNWPRFPRCTERVQGFGNRRTL